MSKVIHIHIHRAKTGDNWEESKHKRATNGQFGSGGGGVAPAAKSSSAAKSAASPDHPEAVAAARHKEEAQKATSPVLKAAHEHLFEARSKNAGSSPSANVKSLGHISRTVHGLLMEHKRMAGNERVQKQLESQIAEALPKNAPGAGTPKPAAKSAPAAKSSEALASEAYSAYVEASNQGDRAKADHFLRQHDKYAKAAKAEKAKRISAGAAPAKDAWEESKHKRATNGQFGSGGGATAKPAAKSASAAKPAIAVKYATSGSSALARLQAQSNAHLKKTGFGHLVTPPKNAPGTGTPKPAAKSAPKSLEAQAREHEDTAAKHHVAAQAEFKKNGKTDEYVRLKNLAQKHTNLGTDLINQAVNTAAKKPAAKSAPSSASPEMASQVTSELNAALKAAGSDYDAKTKAVQAATKTLTKAGFSPDDASSAPVKTQKLPAGVPDSIADAVRNSNGVRAVTKTDAGLQIQIDHHNGYGSATYTLAPDGSLLSGSSGAQSGAGTRKAAGPGEGEAALIKAIGTQAKKTPPSFVHEPNGMRLHPGRREKFSWS